MTSVGIWCFIENKIYFDIKGLRGDVGGADVGETPLYELMDMSI